MNSYAEAALRGQITKKNIKGGIRCEYILGEEQTTRLVPRMIKVERFEDLILSQIDDDWYFQKLTSFYTKKDKDDPSLTERGVAEMQAKFPITLEMAVYVDVYKRQPLRFITSEPDALSFLTGAKSEDFDLELIAFCWSDSSMDEVVT